MTTRATPSKLPWALRLNFLKSVLLKGELPPGIQSWQVGESTSEFMDALLEKPPLSEKSDLKEKKKKWEDKLKKSLEQDSWSYEQTWFYKEALRQIWLKGSPNKQANELGEMIWQNVEKKGISSLNWTLKSNSDNISLPDFSTLDLDTMTHSWLLGWSIACGNMQAAKNLWEKSKVDHVKNGIPLICWATLFDKVEMVKLILDEKPEAIQFTLDTEIFKEELKKKLEKWSIPVVSAYTYNKFESVFHATQWGSNDVLKELIYRGADLNEHTSDGTSALVMACKNSSADSSKLLADGGAYARQRKEEQQSSLKILVAKFQPNVEWVQETWLPIFKSMVDNTGIGYKGEPDIEKQYINLCFQTIEKAREPKILGILLDYMDSHQIDWTKWVGNTNGGYKKERESYSIYDVCLDKDNDDYLAQIAGRTYYRKCQSFFLVTACGPRALKAWMDKWTDTEIETFLSQGTPSLPSENLFKDVVLSKGERRLWRETDTIWDVALKSRNPSVALKTLIEHPVTAGTLDDKSSLKIYNKAWRIPTDQQVEVFNALAPKMTALFENPKIYIPEISNLLNKSKRNLFLVDHLLSNRLLPLHASVDEDGNTLGHLVVKQNDDVLFERLLSAGCTFENSNLAGETALGLASINNPAFHQKMIQAAKERMIQQTKSQSNSSMNIKTGRSRL